MGLENAAFAVAGGVSAWRAAGLLLARLPQINVDELAARLRDPQLQVVDVRRPANVTGGTAAWLAAGYATEATPLG